MHEQTLAFPQLSMHIARISKLVYGLSPLCDPAVVCQNVAVGVFSGITTSAVDELFHHTI